ncbi:uncharacterized protein LOC120208953 [Hibiscus syriacus]|uniref:uncharacterized protein LOC120208953 n=1 Tax=Hibiscus syriacus TaxID=106335 RepID=UPI0019236CB3|nr:uncharacterized protein LOC120208953 [Hibiscus syriacus]
MGKLRDPGCDKTQKPTKPKKNPIKIRYISSPVMVKACNEAEFRAVVQQLTGQNSDIREHRSITEEANQVRDIPNFQADSLAKIDDTNTFPYDMSSLELFDESFVWRGVAENLVGFQSPSIFV